VILHDLFGRNQAESDFLVLAALNDQSNDLHFFGREAVADARAHGIVFVCRSLTAVGYDAALAMDDAAHAVDERRTTDGAMDGSVDAVGQEGLNGLVIFDDDNGPASSGTYPRHQLKGIEPHGRGEDQR